jgi:aspartate carbamoyltransferase catalytic subunit
MYAKKTIDDQDNYLEKVSALEGGFATKKVLINLTEMSDEEFEALFSSAEKAMEDNYKKIFKEKHRIKYFLMEHDFFERIVRRTRKSISIKAWKKKIKSMAHKPAQEPVFNKSQIEELYFRL